MMRIVTCLFFVCACCLHAEHTKSQTVRVNLNHNRTQLATILDDIEAQTDYLFLYNKYVDVNREVSILIKDKPVSEALNQLFSGTEVGYVLEGTHIVLSRKEIREGVAQQRDSVITVTGKITDPFGEAVIGASVLIKGASKGTVTDLNGNFTLEVPPRASLQVSYTGYVPQEIAVNNRSSLSVVLNEDTQALDEVVVVAYGAQKKVNLTGTVSSIKSDQLTNRAATNATNLLVGIAPGLTAIQRSGEPGSDGAALTIRGQGTFNSTTPLVIVDGIPGDMSIIDANDIESISVLKDAASAAIYGVRAANGVILVTTKKGKEGKMSLNYNGNVGFQTPTRLPKWVNAAEYAILYNEALRNDGLDPLFSDQDIEKYRNGTDSYHYPNSNQTDELLSENGLQQSHHLMLDGGAAKIRYNLSLGYLNREGLIKQVDFKRYTLRGNFDFELSSRIKLGMNLSYIRQDKARPYQDIAELVHRSYRETPVTPIRWADGKWVAFMNEHNSVAEATDGGFNNYEGNFFTAIGTLEVKIIDGLSAKGIAAINSAFSHTKAQQYNLSLYNAGDQVGKKFRPYLWESRGEDLDINLQAYLNYDKQFGKHGVTGIIGYEQRKYTTSYLGASRYDLPGNNNLSELNAGDASDQRNEGNTVDNSIRSGFGRLNYNFDQRYLLEFTLRYDGSSRFPKNNRFEFFPSVSAGWRISEESFFRMPLITNLKLRGSWGQLGNQEIGDYTYQSKYSLGRLYGFGGIMYSGIAENYTMANSSIGWESTEMINAGLDLNMFNNKLGMTFDYFIRNTDDILMQLDQPLILGAYAPVINAGAVQNKGFELQLSWNDSVEDFQYNAVFSLARVKDKIQDLKGADKPGRRVGDPINNIFGLEVVGIFSSEEEIEKAPAQDYTGGASPGDLRYKDQNGDNKITADDRVNLGNSFPGMTIGFQLGASYKGFDLSATLQAVTDVQGYLNGMASQAFANGGSALTYQLGRWTPGNPDATYPRVSLNNAGRNQQEINSFFMQNAAYLKMRNLQIGYTLPKKLSESLSIQKCRFYVSADNLFTITNFRGFDPETPWGEGNIYPMVTTYLLGVNLTF